MSRSTSTLVLVATAAMLLLLQAPVSLAAGDGGQSRLSAGTLRTLHDAQARVLRQSGGSAESGCLDQGNAYCIAGHSGPHRPLAPLINCFVAVAQQCAGNAQSASSIESGN